MATGIVQSKINFDFGTVSERPLPGSLLIFTLSRVTKWNRAPGQFPIAILETIQKGHTSLSGDLIAIWLSKPFDLALNLGYGFWLDLDTDLIDWRDGKSPSAAEAFVKEPGGNPWVLGPSNTGELDFEIRCWGAPRLAPTIEGIAEQIRIPRTLKSTKIG